MKFFKLTICVSIFLFSAVFFAHSASAADVFYSVGQNATDHSSGGNVSITSGVATFTAAQTAVNLGVGDRLTAGGNVYYLSTKTSTTVWNVVTALGAVPGDLTSTAVTSIAHEYTTLSAAEAGAGDANHLNTTDLTSGGGYVLNLPCYYDTGADTTAVTVDGWMTGVNNYIKIYTPNNTSTEANQSQKHSGKWDTGKYRLEVYGSAAKLDISEPFTRVDGLQVSATEGEGIDITYYASGNTGGNIISNNIVKVATTTTGSVTSGILQADNTGITDHNYVFNNIVSGSWTQYGIYIRGRSDTARGYTYSNIVYGATTGLRSRGFGYAKNNLSIGCTTAFLETAAFVVADYNAYDQGSDPGTNGVDLSGSTDAQIFVDAPNGDFHLISSSPAKNVGTDTSGESSPLNFTTDIDGGTRSGSWDIGADEGATAIFRSVGPSATSALTTGAGNALTISGTTASFASALPYNVGVGDAIQYDDDGDSDIDANDSIVFISARASSTSYTVQTASGTSPTAVTGDTDWSLFRAYISLSNAETGTENTGIDADLRNFDTWSGGRDLYSNNEQWNISAYANGTTADDSATTIDGWTTYPTNYIKVYTPTAANEVGVSQRHQGKWDDGKYRLETTGQQFTLWNYESYFKLEGLQIKRTYSGLGGAAVTTQQTDNSFGENIISHNIIKEVATGSSGAEGFDTYNITSPDFIFKIYNNVFIDAVNGTSGVGIAYNGASSLSVIYAYNNTFHNCRTGIYTAVADKIVAKNNLFKSCNTAASGTFAAGTGYNATDNVSMGYTVTGGATGDRTSQTFTFVDEDNDDFHLASTDTGAKNFGVDLSADANLAFSTDIDGAQRTGVWDIGADEAPGAIINSPNLPGGSKMWINMSLTDKMTSGLVGMWSFDGADMNWADTTTEAKDRSGNNNHGDVIGATAAIGKRGQALSFDETGDYVNIPANSSHENLATATISLWVNISSDGTVFVKDEVDTSVFSAYVYPDRRVSFRRKYSGGQDLIRICQAGSIQFNNWTHLVVVYDGPLYSNTHIYLDSVECTYSAQSDGLAPMMSDTGKAIRINSNNGPTTGLLDEVRFYNRALSSTEVGDLYRLGSVKIRR